MPVVIFAASSKLTLIASSDGFSDIFKSPKQAISVSYS